MNSSSLAPGGPMCFESLNLALDSVLSGFSEKETMSS